MGRGGGQASAAIKLPVEDAFQLGNQPTPAKARVLVVDDEPQILVALEDLLSDEFVIFKSDSPERALNLIEHEREIAVVVSDQRMPGMTGDEFLARLSARSKATRILVTGFADLSAVIRAVNKGKIFAYVTKPWDADDLRTTIHHGADHFRLTRELARERQLLTDVMNNIPDAIYFKDPDLRYQRVNRAFSDIIGGTSDEITGKRLSELGIDALVSERIESEERKILESGSPIMDDTVSAIVRGETRYFSSTKAVVRGRDGETIGLVGTTRDITGRKEQEARIARLTRIYAVLSGINAAIARVNERQSLLRQTCEIAVKESDLTLAMVATEDPDAGTIGIVTCDASGETHDEIATRGSPEAELLGLAMRGGRPLVVNDVSLYLDESLGTNLRERGHYAFALFPLFVAGRVEGVFGLFARQTNFFDNQEIGLLTELADNISFALSHIRQRERLDFLAYYDELTGLPRRDLFEDRVNQQIAASRGDRRRLAVVLFDIGHFRQVNETLGRRSGDDLLIRVADRLKESVGAQDTLARFGSDSFAALITDGGEEAVAQWLEKTALPRLSQSFMVGETELRLALRAGIALFPSDGQKADTLVANAEAALKKAKATGHRFLFYAPSMNARVAEKLTLETKLRRALERDEFLLHYQPKVDLKTGRVVGLEALIRWRDPEGGLVAPGHFIPILEETGLILDVGRWVLERAAGQYTEWVQSKLNPPRIAVNVSAIQLGQREFVRSIEQVLEMYPLALNGLDLEITESVLIEDLAGNIEKLQAARRLGLCVAIDDFGTGYSSLGYLSRLPIDALKIDRSFIVRMTEDAQDMTIVTTIISLAHAFDLKVIAEGVETAEQARLLRLVKADQIQGYLVAKPQPAETVVDLLGKTSDFRLKSSG